MVVCRRICAACEQDWSAIWFQFVETISSNEHSEYNLKPAGNCHIELSSEQAQVTYYGRLDLQRIFP
jgi:hypothetical protein